MIKFDYKNDTKGSRVMFFKEETYLDCQACYTFYGRADECIKDEDGNLYCPICENLLMDGGVTKIDVKALSQQFDETGLVFEDYFDYLKQLQPLDYAIRPEFILLQENNELSFDKLNAQNYDHVIEIIDHQHIGNYVNYTRKATDKQLSKLCNLQKEVKKYRPDILTLSYLDLTGLYQVQAKRFITMLKIIKLMTAPMTFKQYQNIERIENQIESYFHFDDILTNLPIETALNEKSKLESLERISIYKHLNMYVNERYPSEIATIDEWMQNIGESHIPYNEIKADVMDWKINQIK